MTEVLRRPKTRAPRGGQGGVGFLAPDGIGLVLFVVVPALLALAVGLFDVDGFGNIKFAGLQNFRLMAGDSVLWKSFGVTALYTVLFVPVAFGVSLGLALLVRDHFPGSARCGRRCSCPT